MSFLKQLPGKPRVFGSLPRRFDRSYVCLACRQMTHQSSLYRPSRTVSSFLIRSRKEFSSRNSRLWQKQYPIEGSTEKDAVYSGNQSPRRKLTRSPAASSSLRRVAVEAQRTRNGILSKTQLLEKGLGECKVSMGWAFEDSNLY